MLLPSQRITGAADHEADLESRRSLLALGHVFMPTCQLFSRTGYAGHDAALTEQPPEDIKAYFMPFGQSVSSAVKMSACLSFRSISRGIIISVEVACAFPGSM